MMTKETALKQYFGYDSFRPLQAEIIDNALEGNDALVVMSAGSGKSLACQLTALLRDGIAVIVSPLVPLIKERVQNLQAIGIAAECIHSAQPYEEQRLIEQDCLEGRVKILYISLERLFAGNYFEFLKDLQLSLVAIEESHCVSFWGHDYRGEYTQLSAIKATFPQVPLIALTAVADTITRQDIMKQLGIAEGKQFVAPYNKPNLNLAVLPGRRRLDTIREFLENRPNQSGIIYCLSRKTTEYIAQSLQDLGFKAKNYHAGLEPQVRAEIQEDFVKGSVQIIVATIAFGMGMDKNNIRWVIHYNMPRNLESYYQEIARAGLDGLPADTLILYSYADVIAQMRFNEELPQDRKDLLNMKLERMRQYAESHVCRRRVLLNYFGEFTEQDCGNCDVCEASPATFDATVLAQKALSCIARTNELISQSLLIDILRGTQKKEIQYKGYDKLKTFGVGNDLSQEEWSEYIAQMINLGYINIAYNENYTLKLNERSWDILKNGKTVSLAKYVPRKRYEETQDEMPQDKPKHEIIQDELFERLKGLCKKIADREGILPHDIFSDTALWEMARYKPIRENEIMQITGVNPEKARKHGYEVTEAILAFIREKKGQQNPQRNFQNNVQAKPQQNTYKSYNNQPTYHKPFQNIANLTQDADNHKVSFQLYQSGLHLQQIADRRGIKIDTVIMHLIKQYQEEKAEIDFWQFISRNEYEIIMDAVNIVQLKKGDSLKPLYDELNGEFEYYKLRIALLLWEQEEGSRVKVGNY